MKDIAVIAETLKEQLKTADEPRLMLRAPELGELYKALKAAPAEEKPALGQAINKLKTELEALIEAKEHKAHQANQTPIDVTAPFDSNAVLPELLPTELGSQHPLTTELTRVIDIFTRMGFEAIESRQLDNEYNMFTALNFPEGHPARDGYDTFRTEEGLIPPAHTSTMQNRILKAGKAKLEQGEAIAAISYGRVFRNEDLDATHEHTFYQVEGVYVSKDANLAQMIAVLKNFFETYYGQSLAVKTQPGYFPFVEPGLEFCIEKPASIGGKKGDWLEMLGCGMIHPNVLKEAGINPTVYRGFAWGGGVERLVMLAEGIEDIRYFESGKLSFLRKFA
ncbi:MAG TPA: phenylalanine--tRNA ligase subunit alpha [Candidatus Saccharimonadales bacterium]